MTTTPIITDALSEQEISDRSMVAILESNTPSLSWEFRKSVAKRFGELMDTAMHSASQPKCDLCAGECRGHSLGHPEEWEPEPGSRASQPAEHHAFSDAEIAEAKAELAQPAEDVVERVARALAYRHYQFGDPKPVIDLWIDDHWTDYADDARAAIAALHPSREVEAMREALKPFAEAAKNYGDGVPNRAYLIYGEVTVGHCREARAALQTKEPK